jgi:hypothetical protein
VKSLLKKTAEQKLAGMKLLKWLKKRFSKHFNPNISAAGFLRRRIFRPSSQFTPLHLSF